MEAPTLNKSINATFNLLRITFGVVPIVAGLDKFTDILTHWENYLNPAIARMLPFSAHTFINVSYKLTMCEFNTACFFLEGSKFSEWL